MKFEELKVIEKSIVPIYEKNCIDGSNFHEQVVDARELWKALKSKQEFANWVKKRLDDVDAIEGVDYLTIDKKINRQTLKEYIVTMDIAKEMSMLERNDMGKMIRRYFIESEKRYREMKIIRARSKRFGLKHQRRRTNQSGFLVFGKSQEVASGRRKTIRFRA